MSIDDAKQLMKEKKFKEAILILHDEITKDLSDPVPFKLIGDCYHHLGNEKRMLRFWTKAHRLGFKDEGFEASLMTHNLKHKVTAPPDEVIEEKEALAAFEKGLDLMNAGKIDEAIKAYDDSLAIAPKHFTPWVNKGMCYYQKNDLDKAIECMRNALDINPKSPLNWYNLGTFYNKKQDWPHAIEALKKAADLDPDDQAYWYNLGYAQYNDDRLDQAIESLNEAMRCSPAYTLAMYKLAQVHAKKKEKEKTLEILEMVAYYVPKWKEFIKKEQEFQFLKDDERFKKIVAPTPLDDPTLRFQRK